MPEVTREDDSGESEEVVATDGRVIGGRAMATRQRLLDATEELLDRNGLFELRLVDITREVGTAPATFYQYFSDIDAALLALADDAAQTTHELVEILEPEWSEPAHAARAKAFVAAYVRYWDSHRAVLRVRNLKADEGHAEFRKIRSASQVAMMTVLSRKITEAKSEGRVGDQVDPVATAAAMLAMMERLMAYSAELQQRGTTTKNIEDTLSTILFETVSGMSV